MATPKKSSNSNNRASRTPKPNPLQQGRKEQLEQLGKAILFLEAELPKYREHQKHLKSLNSVSLGIYEELDKLTKKAPAEQVTELILEQVNDVIRETKQLIEADPYIQKLTEFIPAGDLPQQRDVLFVIRQIRQGLERFEENLNTIHSKLMDRLQEARATKTALELFLNGTHPVSKEDIRKIHISVPSQCLIGGLLNNEEFNFHRLDTLDIGEYFQLP
jgi:hypothetical protein